MAIAFNKLPFDEAIAASRDRLHLTRDEFDQLDAKAKSRAFTQAWVTSVSLLKDIHAAHLAALEAGQGLRDFRLALPQLFETRGWSGDRPWHADLVFRQQGQMASMAGRFEQMHGAGVTHWKYSALQDGRARPTHAALDGKVFKMSDRRFYPPWEFNCRCVAEPVFDDELGNEQVDSSQGLAGQQFGSDASGRPLRFPGDQRLATGEQGAGFEWDPASFAKVEVPSPEVLPSGLRSAFEGLVKRGQGTGNRGQGRTNTGSPLVTVAGNGQVKVSRPTTAAEASQMLDAMMRLYDQAEAEFNATKSLPPDSEERVRAALRLDHLQAQLDRAIRLARKVTP